MGLREKFRKTTASPASSSASACTALPPDTEVPPSPHSKSNSVRSVLRKTIPIHRPQHRTSHSSEGSRTAPSSPPEVSIESLRASLDISTVLSSAAVDPSSKSPVSCPGSSPHVVSQKTEGTLSDNSPHLVLPFRRSRPLHRPSASELHIPQAQGAVLTDGFLAFIVPDGWRATFLGDCGFRLISGGCVGYICAVPAAEASLALCDTSRLAVLDAFDVGTSPVVVRHPGIFLMIVEYRNHGAGRGVAMVDDDGDEKGAVVFGLSGPEASRSYLAETEVQILSSAYVVRVPEVKKTGGGGGMVPESGSDTSPTWWQTTMDWACALM